MVGYLFWTVHFRPFTFLELKFYDWIMTVLKLVSKSNALIKRKLVDRVRFRFVRVFRFGRLIKSRFDTIEPSSSDSTPILPPSVFLILEFCFSWIYLNEIETDEDKILKLIETSLEAPALIKTRTLFLKLKLKLAPNWATGLPPSQPNYDIPHGTKNTTNQNTMIDNECLADKNGQLISKVLNLKST